MKHENVMMLFLEVQQDHIHVNLNVSRTIIVQKVRILLVVLSLLV